MRSAALGLALLVATSVFGTVVRADWSGFYASPERAAPQAVVPRVNVAPSPTCDERVPALSAVPALGETPALTTGCAVVRQPPPVAAQTTTDVVAPSESACVRAILAAQARYGIPDNLLMGVGLQEAGIDQGGGVTVWPWSVNAEGEGRFLKDADQAISWVRDRQAGGDTLIDVGCMQINLRWHPDAFASLEEAFDPARNVDYAARYLVGLYERVGDWSAAVGRYHSADPGRAARYLAGVETNLRVLGGSVAAGHAEATPFEGDLDRYLDALVSDTPDRADRPLWSAGLGAARSGEGPVYGPYGPSGLRPVLPNFTKSF